MTIDFVSDVSRFLNGARVVVDSHGEITDRDED